MPTPLEDRQAKAVADALVSIREALATMTEDEAARFCVLCVMMLTKGLIMVGKRTGG